MLSRTLMMLKGTGAKGTLRLSQENGRTKATVIVSGLQNNEEYNVYLFFDEEKSKKIGTLVKGELHETVEVQQNAKACGIVHSVKGNDILELTGETGDFDWDRAKSVLYMKAASKAPENPRQYFEPEPQEEPMEEPREEFREVQQPLEMNRNDPQTPYPEETPDKTDMLDLYYDKLTQAKQPLMASIEDLEAPCERCELPDEIVQSEEEEEMLAKARNAFEQAQRDACDNCPMNVKKTNVHPFYRDFQGYVWEKTEYPGLKGYWHYITGRLYENGVLKKIAIGVPGDYALNPPNWLYGFNTYAYTDDGEVRGYWILFEDA